jgi:hypothetical protein
MSEGQCCASDDRRGRCTEIATWEATVSCVHEHVAVDLLCQRDKETSARLAEVMVCVACENHSSRPHSCRAYLTFQERSNSFSKAN